MPCTVSARKPRIHAERKKAVSRGNAIALNDNRTIVQGHVFLENRQQQVTGKYRIDGDTAFDERSQADVLFKDDDGADLLPENRSMVKAISCEYS